MGNGRMIVGDPDEARCVENEAVDAPVWTCNACDHEVSGPSLLGNALDALCRDPPRPSRELVEFVDRVINSRPRTP